MRNSLYTRILSGIAAAVMTVTNLMPLMPMKAEEDFYDPSPKANITDKTSPSEAVTETESFCGPTEAAEETTVWAEEDLSHQSIELYPNGEEAEQVVSLEGLMPEGATAEAVDVSAEHDGIAAYDITITDGVTEYQPGEVHPILVEITDPVIADVEYIELWHIMDDGTREQIYDFTLEDGTVSFYATGFSVYEIVEPNFTIPDGHGWLKITNIADLANYGEGSSGVYICHTDGYYFTDETYNPKTGRTGIKKTKESDGSKPIDTKRAIELGAAPYYFEKVSESDSEQYYVYCLDSSSNKKYIYNYPNDSLSFSTSSKTAFKFSTYATGISAQSMTNSDKYWNQQGDANGNGFCAYSLNKGGSFQFWYYCALPDDPYKLNNKSYALMVHTSGSSFGNALMDGEDVSKAQLYQLVTHEKDTHNEKELYVYAGSNITMWKFINTTEDNYKLQAASGQYLQLSGSTLSLTDSAESATAFKVIPQTNGAIRLKSGDNYVAFDSSNSTYTVSAAPTDLFFTKETAITGNDKLTCTARRISVSDGGTDAACNGAELIVYTRLWDDTAKQYYYYAIDHNGTLHEVYAYGDKIMWLDDTMNTLLWRLTVYYNADGSENGYYELQNTHSDKYIAPQLTGGQVLSDDKIGILMENRKYEVDEQGKINYGEYYSTIIAWDDNYKQYAALAADSSGIESKAYTLGDTFYFARMDSISSGDTMPKLHEVQTVDNTQYGITMRMIDFPYDDYDRNKSGSSVTKDYFGNDQNNTKGLLSEWMEGGANGTPTVKRNGKDFGAAFNDAVLTNHLFIESVHNATGYFEFDSCQNFATLVHQGSKALTQQVDEHNHPLYVDKDGKLTTSATGSDGSSNTPIYDFTVYRELGTTETSGSTRAHGQFLPYNYIKPESFSTGNPLNMYSVHSLFGNSVLGLLDDQDPRKYEKLYSSFHCNNGSETKAMDPYFGMEMSATFVQTPSGLDAWGHDVIFEFTGDDDFWLYVDGELVLDLGGIHSAEDGTVNFRTGKVTYSTYVANPNALTHYSTTLKDIFEAHYKKKTYTQKEAESHVLRKVLNADRNITLAEYDSLHHEEVEQAKQGYLVYYPDATEEQITDYLTLKFAGRKITFDEYKTLYPNACDYTAEVAAVEGTLHDAEDTEYYLNSVFESNGESGDNAGYVFKDYTTHTMKIYYMERGGGASNLHMKFNLSSVKPGNVLFNKSLVNAGSLLDPDTVQYPFQIFYKTDAQNAEWQGLGNSDSEGHPTVSYQNSTQTVRFAQTYRPAGLPASEPSYTNVFFLIPGKNIEISFPDEAMEYYIVECAVNSDIYDLSNPSINDGNVQLDITPTAISGNIKDLKTHAEVVKQLPSIAFENKLKDDQIRSLYITKTLYDEQYNDSENADNSSHILRYDPSSSGSQIDNTMFKYRLSFWDDAAGTSGEGDWVPADMRTYYILDPDRDICVWLPDADDVTNGKYVKYNIGTESDQQYAKDPSKLTEAQKSAAAFITSRFGAIDNIPAGYIVLVPGLLVGTKFKVEERSYEIPVGYDLIQYTCEAHLVNGENWEGSYRTFVQNEDNSGEIISQSDARMTVSNRRGFGLEADKIWSDADFTTGHEDIYTAVFLKNETTPYEYEGTTTLRAIQYPETYVKYFFKNLRQDCTLNDYHIYEVKLTDPVVNADGIVTNYSELTILGEGAKLENQSIKDTNGTEVFDDYTVRYHTGEVQLTGDGSQPYVRIDTIHNIRKGGVEIRLNQWNTVIDENAAGFKDTPLKGGKFAVYRFNNTTNDYTDLIGDEFVSDKTGIVTVLYGLKTGDRFKVVEISSPRGYVGMAEPVYFEVTGTDSLTIMNWQNANDANTPKLDPMTGKPVTPETAESDDYPQDGKNWAEYETPSAGLAATIDIYNKPFTFNMIKIDGDTGNPLGDVKFQLYKDTVILGALQKGFDPVAGYESLITGEDGIIPKINNTLPPLSGKRYYLDEIATKPGYSLLDEDIIFTVSDLGIVQCENENLLERTEKQEGNTLKVTYVISIPNSSGPSDYYFDIEKVIFIDRYMHDSDKEQKFLFKVDRFDPNETNFAKDRIRETFYVSLNCDNELEYFNETRIENADDSVYPYPLYLAPDDVAYPKSRLDLSNGLNIQKTYNTGTQEDKTYTYPTAIWNGRKTVHVSSEGIYRVSEVTSCSSTDYDFWDGSNVYKGYGTPTSQQGDDGCVMFDIRAVKGDLFRNMTVVIDGVPSYRPTASFTNSESEFAYLSAQAYAENTIQRP